MNNPETQGSTETAPGVVSSEIVIRRANEPCNLCRGSIRFAPCPFCGWAGIPEETELALNAMGAAMQCKTRAEMVETLDRVWAEGQAKLKADNDQAEAPEN